MDFEWFSYRFADRFLGVVVGSFDLCRDYLMCVDNAEMEPRRTCYCIHVQSRTDVDRFVCIFVCVAILATEPRDPMDMLNKTNDI